MHIGETKIADVQKLYVFMNREYSVPLEAGVHKWNMVAEFGYPVSYSGRLIFNVAFNGQMQKPAAQLLYH